MEFSRADRLSGLLRRELANLIYHEIKDPRLGIVTITDVEVSRDLGIAKVYLVTSEGQDVAQNLAVLKRAAGFLRAQLGKTLKLRNIPELRFIADESLDQGARITDLLNKVTHTPNSDNDS